jgi:hypothetical protein
MKGRIDQQSMLGKHAKSKMAIKKKRRHAFLILTQNMIGVIIGKNQAMSSKKFTVLNHRLFIMR